MSPKWTSFKLGLFTLGALAAFVIVAIALGVRGLHEETVPFHTYFDETVTGLEVGAPVRYRGVEVGTVEKVAIAPDGRFIDATLAVRAEEAGRLAWQPDRDTGLRAGLQGQGLTGVKLVNVDFFDPKEHPPPVLAGPPPARYIPATESVLTSLERTVARAASEIPRLSEAILAALAHLERMFDDFDGQRLPARAATALDGVTLAVKELSGTLRRFDRQQIPEKIAATLARLDTAVASVDRVLARVGGDGGLIESTQRATEAVGELGSSTTAATQDLDRTLRDLGDAARAVRSVADALERDPDMLVKGRSKARSP